MSEQTGGTGNSGEQSGTGGSGGGSGQVGSNAGRGRRGNGSGRGRGGRGNYRPLQRGIGNFKGEVPEVGAVLGTITEQREHKDRFKVFQEKLLAYVKRSSNYPNADDLNIVIRKLKDPWDRLEKQRPKKSTEKEVTALDSYDKEFDEEIKVYVQRKRILTNNLSNLYSLVWGQLTESLQSRLKGDEDFEDEDDNCNVLWLLQKVKLCINDIDHTSNKFKTISGALRAYFSIRKKKDESIEDFRSRWEGTESTLSLTGCEDVLNYKVLTDICGGVEEKAIESLRAMNFVLALDYDGYGGLLKELENDLLKGNDNYPTTVPNAYDLVSRYQHVRHNRGSYGGGSGGNMDRRTGFQYIQLNDRRGSRDDPLPGNDGRIMQRMCFRCNKFGHIATHCPFTDEQISQLSSTSNHTPDVQGLNVHISLLQPSNQGAFISNDWILLDSGSTCTSFCNQTLLDNIRPCLPHEEVRALGTGGGYTDYKQIGYDRFLGLPTHFNSNGLANITSLADIMSKYRVSFDSAISPSITVHLSEESYLVFKRCGRGLFYVDTSNIKEHKTKPNVTPYSFVQTVKDNKTMYTKQEIESADDARKLQEYLHWPATKSLQTNVASHLVRNATITHRDLGTADAIYGRAIPILQGKEVRRKKLRPQRVDRMPIPMDIISRHQNVCLHMDFLYVNGNAFFHTKGKKVDYLTIQPCSTRKLRHVKKALSGIKNTYEHAGFKITSYSGDNEFAPLEDFLSPIPIETTAADEHDEIIERSIRTVKDRSRCTCHSIPYRRIPILMLTELLKDIIYCINAFPSKTGISDTISPNAFITGINGIDAATRTIGFGAYCQVYIKGDNSMRTRSIGGISLRPSNSRGGRYFMSLQTGRRVHAHQWTELPIDDDVIAHVEAMALAQKQPLMADGPIFEWTPGHPILDPENHPNLDDDGDTPLIEYFDDSDYESDEDYGSDDDPDDPEDMNLDDENYVMDEPLPPTTVNDNEGFDNLHGQPTPLHGQPNANQGAPHPITDDAITVDAVNVDTDHEEDDDDHEDNADDNYTANEDNDDDTATHNDNNPEEEEDNNSEEEDNENEENYENDEDVTNRNQGANTQNTTDESRRTSNRTRKKPERMNIGDTKRKTYNRVQFSQIETEDGKQIKNDLHRTAVEAIFTQVSEEQNTEGGPGGSGGKQMSASAGIKKYGEKAVAAILKEYKQLIDLDVFHTIEPEKLTEEEKRRSLDMITLIKQKRCGKIKGRAVANGKKQRGYVSKEDSTSPTVSFEGLIATMIVDAYEGRDVAIFDVPGAYLQAEFPEDKLVTVKFVGQFVDIICQVNPEYKKYVRMEGGKKVLYLRLHKALYGCMESALLWYELFTETLQTMGFTVNPYDRCVANRIVNNKQQTICWYVDDNKLSHMDPEVNTEVLEKITKRFGELDISRGKEHTFLGIKFKFLEGKRFEVDMEDYINEAIDLVEECGEKIYGEVSSAAARDLLEIDEKSKELDDKKHEIFHSVVSKLLWVAKRGRPDIDPTISFLCTRVSKPTVQDWKKMKRLLRFLKLTIHEHRIIGADNLLNLFTWIDVSYATHGDARSHTGGAMSLGIGILHYLSTKQKLNVKSSTEGEVVGLSDYVPFNVWYRLFMEAQGFKLETNIIYQDNQSAIRMEKNGRNSCTGNSRHIHIRYMFTKDRLEKGEFSIEYCPTEIMLADYYTKPLQGKVFHMFRRVIMGWDHISKLKEFLESSKERVGNKENVNISKNVTNDPKPSYADVVRQNMKNKRKQIETAAMSDADQSLIQ